MATRKVQRGEVNERVARSIKALREHRRWTLADLSQRLGALGRPILTTGLAKIERGGEDGRRVDVDDLTAIALALEVTPDRLLLGPDGDDTEVTLTPVVTVAAREAWQWASGESPDLLAQLETVTQERVRVYGDQCRPHHRQMTEERRHQASALARPIFDAIEKAITHGMTVDEVDYLVNLDLRVRRTLSEGN